MAMPGVLPGETIQSCDHMNLSRYTITHPNKYTQKLVPADDRKSWGPIYSALRFHHFIWVHQ